MNKRTRVSREKKRPKWRECVKMNKPKYRASETGATVRRENDHGSKLGSQNYE